LVEEFQRHPVQFGGLTVLSEEEERVDLVAFARELHGTLEVRTSVGAAEGDHHSVPADFVRYQVEAAQVVPIELLDAHALVLELVGGQVLRVCVALAAESPPVDQAHPDDDQHQHHEGGQCPEQESTHASHGERLRRVRSARPVTGVIDEAVHCHASSGRTAPSQRLDASSTVIIPTWRSSASSCSTLAWCSGRSSAVASVTTWARTLSAKASRAVWAIQACVDTPASSTVSTPRFPSRSSRSVPKKALSRVFSIRVRPAVSSSPIARVVSSPWKRNPRSSSSMVRVQVERSRLCSVVIRNVGTSAVWAAVVDRCDQLRSGALQLLGLEEGLLQVDQEQCVTRSGHGGQVMEICSWIASVVSSPMAGLKASGFRR